MKKKFIYGFVAVSVVFLLLDGLNILPFLISDYLSDQLNDVTYGMLVMTLTNTLVVIDYILVTLILMGVVILLPIKNKMYTDILKVIIIILIIFDILWAVYTFVPIIKNALNGDILIAVHQWMHGATHNVYNANFYYLGLAIYIYIFINLLMYRNLIKNKSIKFFMLIGSTILILPLIYIILEAIFNLIGVSLLYALRMSWEFNMIYIISKYIGQIMLLWSISILLFQKYNRLKK